VAAGRTRLPRRFPLGGNFRVSEIWDSREEFDAFGERLMPVLVDVGIELSGEPEMLEIHNILECVVH
jgi:hypothetical protein